jgi:hypothetical protein
VVAALLEGQLLSTAGTALKQRMARHSQQQRGVNELGWTVAGLGENNMPVGSKAYLTTHQQMQQTAT